MNIVDTYTPKISLKSLLKEAEAHVKDVCMVSTATMIAEAAMPRLGSASLVQDEASPPRYRTADLFMGLKRID